MKLKNVLNWNAKQDYIERLVIKINDYNDIVIFGAGIGGAATYSIIYERGYGDKISVFSDNSAEKIGKLYMNKEVVEPLNLYTDHSKALILISSTAFNIISKQLCGYGFSKEQLYLFQPACMSADGYSDLNFIKDNYERFEWIFDNTADEKSKKILLYLLNYRISKDINYLYAMSDDIDMESNQYFDEILNNYIYNDGAFVDGGAYIGDTLETFFEKHKAWNNLYYAIEADNNIYDRLKGKYADNKNIVCVRAALWNTDTFVTFDSDNYGKGEGNRISEIGGKVQAMTIDSIVGENSVSFIKLDIEGAEHNALNGAERTIYRDKPIIAVCIYHKREDYFDLPEQIDRICPKEYSFYIRQYRFGQTETVLYAMPSSRRKN